MDNKLILTALFLSQLLGLGIAAACVNAVAEFNTNFGCSTCVPDPLPKATFLRCIDDDIPDNNITSECTTLCQSQIDDVNTNCVPGVNVPDTFTFYADTNYLSIFQIQGLCNFGYVPNDCDAALLRYSLIIKGTRIDECSSYFGEADSCHPGCVDVLKEIKAKCPGENFMVRFAEAADGEELIVGTVKAFSFNDPGITAAFWNGMNAACNVALASLLATPAPTTREEFLAEQNSDPNVAVIAGAVGGVVAVGALAAGVAIFKMRRPKTSLPIEAKGLK